MSFGGSLGAGCINETMAEVIKWHTSNNLKINHIHGYGKMGREIFPKIMIESGISMKNQRLRISEYINDMDTCLAAADLVICRSGSVDSCRTGGGWQGFTILIPSPIVTGNHQFHNANVLGKAGAAIVIEQKDVTNELMIKTVKDLYEHREKLSDMSDNAVKACCEGYKRQDI